jgi:Leucine carboxyl methyltransferase
VRQYVILGAELDSFAYRRHDLLDRLRVFRVANGSFRNLDLGGLLSPIRGTCAPCHPSCFGVA